MSCLQPLSHGRLRASTQQGGSCQQCVTLAMDGARSERLEGLCGNGRSAAQLGNLYGGCDTSLGNSSALRHCCGVL